MTISAISATSTTNQPTPAQLAAQQLTKDMNSLQSALSQGDTSTAQTALTAVTKDLSNSPGSSRNARQALQSLLVSNNASQAVQYLSGSSNTSQSVQSSSISSDTSQALQYLQDALQNGDVPSAQTAFSSLQTSMNTSSQTAGTNSTPISLLTDPNSATETSSSTSLGNFLNALA